MKAAKEKTFFLLVLIATALLSCATATASSTHVLGPENRAEKIFLGGLDRVEQSPLGPANHVEFGTELRTTALGSPVAPSPAAASARHTAWGQNLGAVNSTTSKLGQRALREAGGDWRRAEEIFEGYLQGVSNRLQRTGSKYAVEIQPAANADGRVWNFIQLWHGNRWSDKLYAFPGSRRLDAGIVDMTAQPNSFGLRPLSSGFDITLDARKPNIVQYYQEYFGDIPIFDLRPR